MTTLISGQAVAQALSRVGQALIAQKEYLTSLDQAIGDGDMGITLTKIGNALLSYCSDTATDDLGKFLLGAGMTANRAGPSTMGTLLATALMRAGKVVKGKSELTPQDLAEMFAAADKGIQDRGKAKLGDKTIVDAVHPANEAFAQAIAAGDSLAEAGQKALQAAKNGLDSVTPLRSKIGRASWVGERTEGKVDPGCAAFVIMLSAILEPSSA
ncbi:MAG: dihydroxyacetone kinase subunit L [Chloroflexi bacterium]|nr:dihydroxyacetone kinase subunit L [Chloroflexota bacterium]